MELLKLQEADITALDKIYKQWPLAHLIASLIMFGLATGMYFLYRHKGMPMIMLILTCLFFIFLGCLFFSLFKKAL